MCIYVHACARRYVAGYGVGAATNEHALSRSSHTHAAQCTASRATGATARQTPSLRSGALHEGAHTLAGMARLIYCNTKSCHNGIRGRLRPFLSRVLPLPPLAGATQRSAPCRECMVGSGHHAHCSRQRATRRGIGRPLATATATPRPGQSLRLA